MKNEIAKVPRNDPCPCGSVKKYKNCHGRNPGKGSKIYQKLFWVLLGILVIGGTGIGFYSKKSKEKPPPPLTPTTEYFTQIPDVDLTGLSEEKKKAVLDRANRETCGCGCNHTLAYCVIKDPGCPLVADVKSKIQGFVNEAKGG